MASVNNIFSCCFQANVITTVTSTDNVGFFSRIIWTLFAPIYSVYNYVLGYFTGAPASPPERRQSNDNVAAGGPSGNADRFGRITGQPSG